MRPVSGAVARRFLALVFPMLPFERLRATRPTLFGDDAPVALTQRIGGTERLAMVDPAAARAGLATGGTVAAARAVVPALIALPADPHGDCDWLERLAEGFARYTPQVRLDPADGLTLDLSGRPGDDATLVADLETRLARRGVIVRHAFGGTPAVARALARFAGGPAPDEAGAVRRLPVAALELEAEETEALVAAGLRTVGDAAARPQAALAAQFGRAVVEAVRVLTDPRAPLPPLPTPSARQVDRALDAPAMAAKTVLAEIAAALAPLVAEMTAAGEGGCDWEAALFTGDGQRLTLRVETPEPGQAAAPVLRGFARGWSTLAERLAAGGGCDLVRVRVLRAAAIGTGRLALEGGVAVRPDRAARLRRSAPAAAVAPSQLGLAFADPVVDADRLPAETAPAERVPESLGPVRAFDPPSADRSRRRGGALARARAVRPTGLPLRRVPPQIAGQHKWEQ